jgi:hypothetical protein
MNNKITRLVGLALAASSLGAAGSAFAAGPAEIRIPGTKVFPESLTSGSDGNIYIGSVGQAQVYRVPRAGHR